MMEKQLSLGDAAPAFTLKDQTGKAFHLQDYKGKNAIVLIFYPGDMTPGCTMQLCAIRDDWQKFTDAGIFVYGVNHADAESHQLFIDKHHFPFPILIDSGKKISAKFGATKTFFKTMIIKRSVIGIDKQGTIRYLRRGMPKNAEILKAMLPFA